MSVNEGALQKLARSVGLGWLFPAVKNHGIVANANTGEVRIPGNEEHLIYVQVAQLQLANAGGNVQLCMTKEKVNRSLGRCYNGNACWKKHSDEDQAQFTIRTTSFCSYYQPMVGQPFVAGVCQIHQCPKQHRKPNGHWETLEEVDQRMAAAGPPAGNNVVAADD